MSLITTMMTLLVTAD
ncbi:hypothetical protein LINPERPRIM_LOCUS30206 [Linum perenne]